MASRSARRSATHCSADAFLTELYGRGTDEKNESDFDGSGLIFAVPMINYQH